MALSIFVVSLTVLMFYLSGQIESEGQYGASVIDATHIEQIAHQEQIPDYSAQMDGRDESMVILGLDGSIDHISADILATYNLTEQEVKANLYFNYVHPEDLPALLSSIGKVIENKTPVAIVGPFRMKIKQPQYTVFIASLYPITTDEGSTKVAVLLSDITDDMNLPREQLEESEDTPVEDEHQIEIPGKFEETIRNEQDKDTETRLVVQNKTGGFDFINPFLPFLLH